MAKYEITLEELFAPIAKPKSSKPKTAPARIPGERHNFVERHLTPPQFLNETQQIHSARAKQEQVRKAGPDFLLAQQLERQAQTKVQSQLYFAQYAVRFLCQLLEHNHD
jgi:hypothetical protein